MEGIFALLIPICALMIPIVAILTGHQRKMAELMHSTQQNNANPNEIADIRRDMARLQEVVSTLAINVDNLKDEIRSSGDIQDRMKVGE